MRASSIVPRLAAGVLLCAVAYAYGALSYKFDWWPYSAYLEIKRFVAGHPEEKTSLADKVLNDIGILPARMLRAPAPLSYPRSEYRRLGGLGLDDSRDNPLIYLSPAAPRGYRVLYGVFVFKGNLHGLIMLGPDGKVSHVWKVSQRGTPWEHAPDTNSHPHGFEIFRDGSVIVAYDNGDTLTRYDYCGKVLWRLPGTYHHSIESGDGRTVWVWRQGKRNAEIPANNDRDGEWTEAVKMGQTEEWAERIAVADGKILRTFSIQQVIDANPGIDIFGLRQIDRAASALWADDPYHLNDIDPLPEGLARFYPQFRAGDLLISARSLDLIAVLDPVSLEVKWWRIGQVRRQHDPDWNRRGTITVFDNDMHRPPSDIVEIVPGDMSSAALVSGAEYGFYSYAGGKHEILPGGDVLITSRPRGRVFEVAPDGTVNFDFHNIYSDEDGALPVSGARFLPPDFFTDLPRCAPR